MRTSVVPPSRIRTATLRQSARASSYQTAVYLPGQRSKRATRSSMAAGEASAGSPNIVSPSTVTSCALTSLPLQSTSRTPMPTCGLSGGAPIASRTPSPRVGSSARRSSDTSGACRCSGDRGPWAGARVSRRCVRGDRSAPRQDRPRARPAARPIKKARRIVGRAFTVGPIVCRSVVPGDPPRRRHANLWHRDHRCVRVERRKSCQI